MIMVSQAAPKLVRCERHNNVAKWAVSPALGQSSPPQSLDDRVPGEHLSSPTRTHEQPQVSFLLPKWT
jgi:hypothetical protein